LDSAEAEGCNLKKWITIIFAIGIFALDVGFGHRVILSLKTLNYKKTQGIITFNILQKHSRDGYDVSKADVGYSYQTADVSGNETTRYSNRLSYIPMERRADLIVDEYPKDASVDVYYDPSHPDDAVLFPDMEEFQRSTIFCLLPLNALAVLLMIPAFGGKVASRLGIGTVVFGGFLFMEMIVCALFNQGNQPLSLMLAAVGVAIVLSILTAWRFNETAYRNAIASNNEAKN
jgi:hypothetical protein